MLVFLPLTAYKTLAREKKSRLGYAYTFIYICNSVSLEVQVLQVAFSQERQDMI
jgi:hypothetical protein